MSIYAIREYFIENYSMLKIIACYTLVHYLFDVHCVENSHFIALLITTRYMLIMVLNSRPNMFTPTCMLNSEYNK